MIALTTSVEEKKSKNKIYLFGQCWEQQTATLIALCLVHWLMLARRLYIYNAGLKLDTSWEILTVVMTSYYENVCSCKRHTVVRHTFCFWRFASLFLGLATHYHESWWSVKFRNLKMLQDPFHRCGHIIHDPLSENPTSFHNSALANEIHITYTYCKLILHMF